MYKILMIEDEEIIRADICMMLELEGYQISCAANGREGLNLISADKPDLIICDIIMPEMNGYELIKAIRHADTPIRNLPFIFLSAKTAEEDKKIGLGLGANAYLTKPFNPDKLLETVQNLLK